jgi:hypothetical protein
MIVGSDSKQAGMLASMPAPLPGLMPTIARAHERALRKDWWTRLKAWRQMSRAVFRVRCCLCLRRISIEVPRSLMGTFTHKQAIAVHWLRECKPKVLSAHIEGEALRRGVTADLLAQLSEGIVGKPVRPPTPQLDRDRKAAAERRALRVKAQS